MLEDWNSVWACPGSSLTFYYLQWMDCFQVTALVFNNSSHLRHLIWIVSASEIQTFGVRSSLQSSHVCHGKWCHLAGTDVLLVGTPIPLCGEAAERFGGRNATKFKFLGKWVFPSCSWVPICVGSYNHRPGILRSCQILWLQCVAGDQESMSRSKFSVDLLPADG
jgi:hypothetical protein